MGECRRMRRKAGKPLLVAQSVPAAAGTLIPFGWRDAMDIIVKWRQLSEPNDQVQMLQAYPSDTCLSQMGIHLAAMVLILLVYHDRRILG